MKHKTLVKKVKYALKHKRDKLRQGEADFLEFYLSWDIPSPGSESLAHSICLELEKYKGTS
jgi:hypothetical protein